LGYGPKCGADFSLIFGDGKPFTSSLKQKTISIDGFLFYYSGNFGGCGIPPELLIAGLVGFVVVWVGVFT